MGAIILAIVAIGVLAIGGLMVLGLVSKVLFPSTPPIPESPPTVMQTTRPQPTSAPVPKQTTPPKAEPAPPINKNPPPADQPETYTDAKKLLTNGAFFQAQVPANVSCQGTAIPPGTTSKATYQAALDAMTACLMKTWTVPIKQSGYAVYRPSVTIYSGEITTKCGKAKTENAFFCAADQQIYFANDMPGVIASVTEPSAHLPESIIAHEFGHLLQYRTGWLVAAHAFAEKAESKSAANEWIRRLEGNADCLAGLYTRSVYKSQGLSEADLKKQAVLFQALGDDNLSGDPNIDGDHGLGKTRISWFVSGVNSDKVAVCNSFTAPKEKVR